MRGQLYKINDNSDCQSKLKNHLHNMFSIKHFIKTFLHVLHNAIGYFLMLAFMTYNYWICLSILIGIGIGYFIFGASRKNSDSMEETCSWIFDYNNKVFLLILERERERDKHRERFPLFVPRRYCVSTRTFLDVLDRSAFTVLDRSWPLRPFMSVFDSFMSLLRQFETLLWPEKLKKGHETVRNGDERWTLRNLCKITFTFTFQNKKKRCIYFYLTIDIL